MEDDAGDALDNLVHDTLNQLYLKYVDKKAALELNIRGSLKHQLQALFDSEVTFTQSSSTLPPMDAAAKEISILMNDSGTRYFHDRINEE